MFIIERNRVSTERNLLMSKICAKLKSTQE